MITYEHLSPIDHTLGELMNLMDAVGLIGHELGGMLIPKGPLSVQRNAACGVIDATIAKAGELQAAFDTLYVALKDKEPSA